MITSGEWLNPTRAVGLLAYGTATICCGIAWMRAKIQGQDWRLAALLTLIESVLLLDIAFDWRWMLHAFVGDFARRRHEYELRHEPQLIALVISGSVFVVGPACRPTLLSRQGWCSSGGIGNLAVSGCVVCRGCFSSCCRPHFVPSNRQMDGRERAVDSGLLDDIHRYVVWFARCQTLRRGLIAIEVIDV